MAHKGIAQPRLKNEHRVIVLLDLSQSIDTPVGAGRQRIDVLSSILRQVLRDAPATRLVAFNSTVAELEPGSVPEPAGRSPLHIALRPLWPGRVIVICECEPDHQAANSGARARYSGRGCVGAVVGRGASFILHVQYYWSFAARSKAVQYEREYAAQNGVRPLDLRNGPLPQRLLFATHEEAKRHALLLKVQYGDDVANSITGDRPRVSRQHPRLADWRTERVP
jgi:hypothetical protein